MIDILYFILKNVRNQQMSSAWGAKYVKHGKVKGVQRYLCRHCGYKFTVSKKGKSIEKEYVARAIQLYLEGLGFRAIERILGVSHASVINWVWQLGSAIELIRLKKRNVEVVEEDELCSFVVQKNYVYPR